MGSFLKIRLQAPWGTIKFDLISASILLIPFIQILLNLYTSIDNLYKKIEKC